MSDQVSRHEFEELKGQIAYLAHQMGIEMGEDFATGTGRHRAEASVETEERFDGFDQSEDLDLGDEEDYVLPVEEEDDPDAEGWESINDDDDEEHTIQEPESHSLPVLPPAYDEVDELAAANAATDEDADEEVTILPTALEEDEDEGDDNRPNPFGETPELNTGSSTNVETGDYSEIFDAENALTANHVATQEFTSIKKGLFNSPYDEDAVDDYLDAIYDMLQSRDASDKRYAEALLDIRSNRFPESNEGYKKSEVDEFIEKIAAELQRRIDILS